MPNKIRRPPIPPKTQLQLWIAAGGRCSFYGCNRALWYDGLTLKRQNYSNIAHIISWTPTGPRGDKILSQKLATDFDNLMLMCQDHADLIDGDYREEYSVEVLRQYKKNHEDRIRVQTDAQDNLKTTVLRFQARIGDMDVGITRDQIAKAIAPRYPTSDKEIEINLSQIHSTSDTLYWKQMANQVDLEVKRGLAVGLDGKKVEHISVFAIAPIPLLIQLGFSLSNVIPVSLFQHHKRPIEGWSWPQELTTEVKFTVSEIKRPKSFKKVALVLSLSGNILPEDITRFIDDSFAVYEIAIDEPSFDFLQSQEQVKDFEKIYRNLIDKIRDEIGSAGQIHVFPAIPVPLAIVCGRAIYQKCDPKLLLYDQNKHDGGFKFCLEIN